MPIHLEEVDVMSKVEGLDSTLIVACNMCAGASFAMKENKPFIQLFSNFLTSPPLDRHITKLQFQLKEKEYTSLRFHIGSLKRGQHSKYLPYVFIEQGVAMLSSVVKSDRAININIQIMRAFIKLRELLFSNKKLAKKLNELEKKQDKRFIAIID